MGIEAVFLGNYNKENLPFAQIVDPYYECNGGCSGSEFGCYGHYVGKKIGIESDGEILHWSKSELGAKRWLKRHKNEFRLERNDSDPEPS